jgi:hypothetical protein
VSVDDLRVRYPVEGGIPKSRYQIIDAIAWEYEKKKFVGFVSLNDVGGCQLLSCNFMVYATSR